jgi:probable phosphoglycerate mutase
VETRIQGQLDIPLNTKGQWQASKVAQALAQQDTIHAVYSSDLLRALETARAIAASTGAPLQTHTGLRERGFGLFEGKTFVEIENQWPEESRRWRQREPHWAPPKGGESLVQLRERISNTLHELAAQHEGQQIVLVAHGGVLDQLYRVATGLDLQAPRTWELNNAALNRLLWTPQGLSLVGWADTLHLDNATLDELDS